MDDHVARDGVFPNGPAFLQGQLRVRDQAMQTLSVYTTYDPLHAVLDEEMEHVGFYGDGVWDIILTAEVRR